MYLNSIKCKYAGKNQTINLLVKNLKYINRIIIVSIKINNRNNMNEKILKDLNHVNL